MEHHSTIPSRILFICIGNLCRSPMAEAICKDIIARDEVLGRLGIRVSSAGTMKLNSAPATTEAIQVMTERGLDIGGHRSRIINRDILDAHDLILTMENAQKGRIVAEYPGTRDKVFLLSEYAGASGDIIDPIGEDINVYRSRATEIEKYLRIILARLVS